MNTSIITSLSITKNNNSTETLGKCIIYELRKQMKVSLDMLFIGPLKFVAGLSLIETFYLTIIAEVSFSMITPIYVIVLILFIHKINKELHLK